MNYKDFIYKLCFVNLVLIYFQFSYIENTQTWNVPFKITWGSKDLNKPFDNPGDVQGKFILVASIVDMMCSYKDKEMWYHCH